MQHTPLAERMRPEDFDSFFGQQHIAGKDKLLRKLIENNRLTSVILWGPPGTGKTTLAHIVAKMTDANFVVLSGVNSGKADLRKVVAEAEELLKENKKTVLFIDEIHRWSKAQQDALLPNVEKGVITLIGATTENPSFEVIGALLSRSQVFILKNLAEEDIVQIIKKALSDKEKGLGNYNIEIEKSVIEFLAGMASGDARCALNGLDLSFRSKYVSSKKGKTKLSIDDIKEALQRTHLVFDNKGEQFYNLISALHKSMRGSDANASLYWLARMLEGGADPLYLARRILRFASEDIGMANAEALIQVNAVYDACHKIGMPECSVHLAHAVVYCAKSKKSNLLYRAYEEAAIDARNTSHLGVPLHLRNAPTKFMKEIGYGADYQYNPDSTEEVVQDYLPPELKNKNYLSKTPTRYFTYMQAQKDKKKKV